MADVFVSFASADIQRARLVVDALREQELMVFWSADIPIGSSNYHAIIIDELLESAVVVVLWTLNSVKSQPVAQECDQARRDGKLIQVVLDHIDPIRFPFEAGHLGQKAMLVGWNGDLDSDEWTGLVDAIEDFVYEDSADEHTDNENEPEPDPLLMTEEEAVIFMDGTRSQLGLDIEWGDDISESPAGTAAIEMTRLLYAAIYEIGEENAKLLRSRRISMKIEQKLEMLIVNMEDGNFSFLWLKDLEGNLAKMLVEVAKTGKCNW
jgi:TIR domain